MNPEHAIISQATLEELINHINENGITRLSKVKKLIGTAILELEETYASQ